MPSPEEETKLLSAKLAQSIYLVVKIIQVGISALQLHHLDFRDPILFSLQHEIGIWILPEMILVTAPVTSSVSCTIEIPMLTETQRPHFLQVGTLIMPYNYTGVHQAN